MIGSILNLDRCRSIVVHGKWRWSVKLLAKERKEFKSKGSKKNKEKKIEE